MIRALTHSFTEAQRALSDAEQGRLAELIGDFIAQAQDLGQFHEDMKDPDHRANVEGALAEGEADIQAGRFVPLADVFDPKIKAFKANHGL